MNERQKYLFVINPVAGGVDKSDFVDRLEEWELAQKPSILWTGPETALDIQKEIEAGHYDAVVAVGGDGTVHMVAQALMGSKVPMGIIPFGSGNGLAKDLSLPLDPEEALRVVLHSSPHSLDAILFNGQHSFHICDAGLNARVVMDYGLGKHRTLRAYAWHLLKFYFSAGPALITLHVDESAVFEGRAYMVALCTGQRYGSDLFINPTGKLDDGIMEVVVLKEFPKSAGPGILLDLMAGDIDPSYFSIFKGKSCQFTSDVPWPWQLDGEFAGKSTTHSGHVLPDCVQVLRDV